MRDVIRRKWDETCPTSLPTHTTSSVIHPDAEALRELQSLVDGEAPFDLSNSDEYIERAVAIGAKPLLRKLRRGQYAIQAVLDLHGMDREEARHSVESFILRAVGLGRGCVKIIHGRGHNSKENRAVLKELLQLWLATRRMSRYVLAYTSARPCDGGAGAVYVLLRRPHRGR
jgi:DNA-nicking Smr family endonuclease